MPYFKHSTGGTYRLIAAPTLEAAIRMVQGGTPSVSPAEPADIDWMRAMNGRVPEDVPTPAMHPTVKVGERVWIHHHDRRDARRDGYAIILRVGRRWAVISMDDQQYKDREGDRFDIQDFAIDARGYTSRARVYASQEAAKSVMDLEGRVVRDFDLIRSLEIRRSLAALPPGEASARLQRAHEILTRGY